MSIRLFNSSPRHLDLHYCHDAVRRRDALTCKHEAVASGCAETSVRLLISEQITSVGTNQDSPGVKAPLAYVKRKQM